MSDIVRVDTSLGSFEIELYTQHAPRTCANFKTLSSIGYYNDSLIHRVIKDFMCQMGDPTGTGRGGECCWGGKFEDEINHSLKFTGAGIVAMANSGPNTNGSQFFVTLAPTPWLDGKHTIFGRIASGMDVIKRMGAVPTNQRDSPVVELKIVKI